MEGYCNYCNSSLRSLKGGKFFDELGDHQHVTRNLLLGLSYGNISISLGYKNVTFDEISLFSKI